MDKLEMAEIIRTSHGFDIEEITEVSGGISGADKFKVRFDGKNWIAKIVEASEERVRWYEALAQTECEYLAVPRYISALGHNKALCIAPWIDGQMLETVFSSLDSETIQEFGRQTASVLKELHSRKTGITGYEKLLKLKTDRLCSGLNDQCADFPGKDECIKYIQQYAEKIAIDSVACLHRDIRPENIIINNRHVCLIDFDNGMFGEPEADFVYLTTMGDKAHIPFSVAVIRSYLKGCDEQKFWEKNMFYSTLQVMDYTLWKYQRKGRVSKNQVQNLLDQYDHFRSPEPVWMKEKEIK